MPLYEFSCEKHGRFGDYRPMGSCTIPSPCPVCNVLSERVISLPAINITQGSQTLQFGSGSPGRMVTPEETGGMGVYIPSMGAMEQAEVDYIAEGAIAKEKARVKNAKGKPQRRAQEKIQGYTNLVNSTPRKKRINTLREAIKEYG